MKRSYCSLTLFSRSSHSSFARWTSLGSGPLPKISIRLMKGHVISLRNMEVHNLIAFLTCRMLHETRTATFDLDTATSLLLNMLHVGTSMTNNLSSKIESRKGLKINWNTLFRPFTLFSDQFTPNTLSKKLSLPARTHHALLDQALYAGIVAHRPDLEALAALNLLLA